MKNPLKDFYVDEKGSKLVCNIPFNVRTELKTTSYKQNEILVAYFLGSSFNPPVYPLFKREDLDMILEMGAKKPRKLSTEFFIGRIGERILQIRFDEYLARLKKKRPNLEYRKAEGEAKTIIGVGGGYIAAIQGHHNNVVILKSQEDYGMPLKKRHIGKKLKREVRNILDTVGEIDSMYFLDFSNANHSIVLCEAKTGQLDKKPDEIIKCHINPIKQIFQSHEPEITYCLMATEEMLLEKGKKKSLRKKVENLYNALKQQRINLIVIPFNETSSELEQIGEKLYRQYLKIRGPADLKIGTALYNDGKIIIKNKEGRLVSNIDRKKGKIWREIFSKK